MIEWPNGTPELNYPLAVDNLPLEQGVKRPCPRCTGSGSITITLRSMPPYWQSLLRSLSDGDWHRPDELPQVTLASTRRQALVGMEVLGLVRSRQLGSGRYKYEYQIAEDGVTILGGKPAYDTE